MQSSSLRTLTDSKANNVGGALRDLHIFQNEEQENKTNPTGITFHQNASPDTGKMKFVTCKCSSNNDVFISKDKMKS